MVRFNSPQPKTKSSNTIKNYEGGAAFRTDKYNELYLRTATQLVLTDKFYGDKDQQFQEWITLVREIGIQDPEFVLKLAAYVRNEMKLRTAPIIMLVETILAYKATVNYTTKDNEIFYKYAPRIIQRADELAEIIAYFQAQNGDIGNGRPKGSLPNVFKKIINRELLSDKFNDYQLVKNDKNNAKVSLRDVLRITHPKPKDRDTERFFARVIEQDSFADIAEQTWEGIISKAGSNKETWSKALEQMPIMALVRNLRNLLDNDVSLELAYQKLSDPEIIRKSRLLPFRFYQAYKEVNGRDRRLDTVLNTALLHATANIPEFPGGTAVFVDTSGSMDTELNNKSKIKYNEIAALFGTILYKKMGAANTVLFVYDDDVRQIKPTDGALVYDTIEVMLRNKGGATYAHKCMEVLLNNSRFPVDRIIFLSDMQSYNDYGYGWSPSRYGSTSKSVSQLLDDYRKKVNPNAVLYDIDLSGYGTVQFDPKKPLNIHLAGWSERIFDLMNVFDKKVDIKQSLSTY